MEQTLKAPEVRLSRSAIETAASSEQIETNKCTMIMEMRIRNTSFALHRRRGLRRILGPKQKTKDKQRRGGMNGISYWTSNTAENDSNQNTIRDISQHPSTMQKPGETEERLTPCYGLREKCKQTNEHRKSSTESSSPCNRGNIQYTRYAL